VIRNLNYCALMPESVQNAKRESPWLALGVPATSIILECEDPAFLVLYNAELYIVNVKNTHIQYSNDKVFILY
jgi:hypothetical protein